MKIGVLITTLFIGVSLSCAASAWTQPTPQDIIRLTSAAEKGDAKALTDLGDAYEFGLSVKIDEQKAVKYWSKAAEQNYAFAEFRLGEVYGDDGSGNGTGTIPPDPVKAMKWLERSASHGNPLAKCALGQVYELAFNGVTKDHAKAKRYFEECVGSLPVMARDGDADAELILALLYENGWGLPVDKAEAFKLRLRNAQRGFPGGEAYVALCYYHGIGVTRNLAESVKWMSVAADHGQSLAQLWLGSFYAKGEGVPQDLVKAYLWLDLAVVQGVKQGTGPLAEISKSLTKNELSEATRLSHEWQAQHLAPH